MRNGYVSEGDSSEYARDLRISEPSPVSYQVKPGASPSGGATPSPDWLRIAMRDLATSGAFAVPFERC